MKSPGGNLEKGLIISQPWVDKIFDGEKTWEMRSRHTKIRGRIGIIERGTGLIVGSVKLVASLGPLSNFALKQAVKTHRINYDDVGEEALKWNIAWVFTEIQRFKTPIPYNHPQGAVIWVNL